MYSSKENSFDSPVIANGYPSLVAVLTKYAPLVKSRALSFLCYGCELDDLVQEGNIGLLTAVAKYNSGLSAFTTFARKCIDSAIIDYLRKHRKISGIPEGMLVDINGIEVADTSPDPEYSVYIKDEYRHMVDKAGTVLSGYEFAVFSDMLRGYSFKEIAVRNSCGIKSVRNAVQRIRAKLQ